MEETSLLTVDETKLSVEGVCEKHKESLDLFCVEDQTLICAICRQSWDHMLHTVMPRELATSKKKQGTESLLSGYEEGFPEVEPTISTTIGNPNMTPGSTGEMLNGNKKVNADELMLIEQWVDFNLTEKKEEGGQSNFRAQNSITWILLILFIIQIVGLITTIFVFTMAKPDIPAALTATPCCPQGWIMTQGSCYHFVELEGAWEAGQHHCSSLGASLAVIDNLEKLNVIVNHKGASNHWVGLSREPEGSWKWPDGTVFNNHFEVEGDGQCTYLDNRAVSSAECSAEKKWLCSRKMTAGSHGHCRGT